MNDATVSEKPADIVPQKVDSGLRALTGIAGFYRIASDPLALSRELALGEAQSTERDILRAANMIGIKARPVPVRDETRLADLPTPAIVQRLNGDFLVYGGKQASGKHRIVDPVTRRDEELDASDILKQIHPRAILVARKWGGPGIDPRTFGFRWFLPSIWRYRKPLGHVLLASFFVQIFALVTPLFFQVVIDKVLQHNSYDTLYLIVGGLVVIGLFDVALQYLRT